MGQIIAVSIPSVLTAIAVVAFSVPALAQTPNSTAALERPYLPTRAVVPTKAQLPTLAAEAYKLGACHDSIRWYKQLRQSKINMAKTNMAKTNTAKTDMANKDIADLGIARCYERQGRYADALDLLNTLRERKSPYLAQANKLRGHVLLLLTEQAQLRGKLEKSEAYLRTFFGQHRNQRSHERYAYLMRQQATLSGLKKSGLKKGREAGSFSSPQRATPQRVAPLRVGLLLPLTGYMGSVGKSMEKAAILALYAQQIPNLTLYPEDTKGTPDGTQKAFERAQQNGVDIVLGPLLGNNVKAIAAFAQSVNVPLISFSSDTNALLNSNVRLFSILPTNQAKRMARYAVDAQGLRTFSALLPDNRYGRAMRDAFKEELARLGAKLDRHAFFTPGTPDLKKPLRYLSRMAQSEKKLDDALTELEERHAVLASAMDDDDLKRLETLRKTEAQPDVRYQALFVPASGDAMPLISSQLAFYDSDGTQVQLLGSSQWDSANLLSESRNYLKNGIYPTTPNTEQAQFITSYRNTYNQAPHGLAKLAYDGVNLIGHLTRHGLRRGKNLEKRLLRLKAFHGATGPYQILQNGTLKHGYSLIQIYGTSSKKEITTPPYLLPPETQPLQTIKTVGKRSQTPRSNTKSSGFFGGLFGN